MYRLIAAATCFACVLADLRAQGRPAMKLELVLPRHLYLAGEKISIDVQLTNTGAEAIDAPTLETGGNAQPVFHLQGPAYPQGISFNLRDAKRGAEGYPPPPPSTHHVAAGGMMEGGFILNSIMPINEPGEYRVSARMDWNGWSAEAAPIKFSVDKAKFVEASLGMDVFSRSTRSVRAVWIAESAEGRLLGESSLYETRPELGEVSLSSTRIIRGVGAKATNPFCPWVNFDRIEAPKFWHGWQEGAALMAFSDDEKEPRTFDIGSPKAQIVQPTYMNHAGDLDVLVLGENRKTLRLVRFAAAEGNPSVVWSIDLRDPVSSIALGVGAADKGGPRVVTYVTQTGLKMSIHLMSIGDKPAEADPPAVVTNAFLLPDSQPSVSIAADGTIHASVVYAKHPGLGTLAVADLISQAGKGRVTTADVGRTDAGVVKAWTAQRVTMEGPPARVWLARTAQGSMGGLGESKPVQTALPVVDYLRMSGAAYVLVLDPNRGPMLVETGY